MSQAPFKTKVCKYCKQIFYPNTPSKVVCSRCKQLIKVTGKKGGKSLFPADGEPIYSYLNRQDEVLKKYILPIIVEYYKIKMKDAESIYNSWRKEYMNLNINPYRFVVMDTHSNTTVDIKHTLESAKELQKKLEKEGRKTYLKVSKYIGELWEVANYGKE